jgi:S-DNA-T family DNA segregation ATPase FtsK/SpoIIIE
MSECARCGLDLPETGNTCPRCGAPRPHPAWTVPVGSADPPTIESARSPSGTLTPGKKYALVVVAGTGDSSGRVIPIEKPRITLGRMDCDVTLEDPQLSRQHATITVYGASARLQDLGSTNGTFVDDERIEEAELADRTEFRIGTHQLVFVVRDEDF